MKINQAKKSKQVILVRVVSIIALAALVSGILLHQWLNPTNKITLSLASDSTDKISEPFRYRGYTKPEYKSYTKQSQYVSMDDGVRIAVDVYLPADGPETDRTSYPAVFLFTPYGRAFTIPGKRGLTDRIKMKAGVGTADSTIDRANSHDSVYGSTDEIVQTLLSCGYAYICADVRGTGVSYGVKVDFMPEIATDGKQVVDWITQQSWSDGNVGMFGGSYLGYTQLVIAAEQPKALKAIFPEVVAFDGYSSEISPGGAFVQLYSDEDIQTLYEMNMYLPEDLLADNKEILERRTGEGLRVLALWCSLRISLGFHPET